MREIKFKAKRIGGGEWVGGFYIQKRFFKNINNMSKVITFSRTFPAHHPKAGQPTYFVEQILNGLGVNYKGGDVPLIAANTEQLETNKFSTELIATFRGSLSQNCSQQKHHAIRAGNRWKVGDKFSPRVWSDRPYRSKQIIIAPDIEIKKVWDFYMKADGKFYMPAADVTTHIEMIANNDGLSLDDFKAWFKIHPKQDKQLKQFVGQIICWNENIKY